MPIADYAETTRALHLDDAHRLESDGYVHLFTIELIPSGVLHLKNGPARTWQGSLYEEWGLKLDGVARAADDQRVRPKLTVANPEGLFSALIAEGKLDGATVLRTRVLHDDLVHDRPYGREERWTVSRIASLTKTLATFELRNQLDGPFFTVPARMFLPPEFPSVSLS